MGKDETEKSIQVLHMCDIYTYACCDYAWVSLDDGEITARTMECLTEMGSTPLDIDMLTGGCVHLIDQFVGKPWFERVWVIQEVTLGAQQAIIQCGRFGLPYLTVLDAFRRAHQYWVANGRGSVTNLVSRIAWRTEHFLAAEEILARTQQGHKVVPLHLAMTIGHAAHLGVTDDRDRIWGLLGLLPEEDRFALWPDYERVSFEKLENRAVQRKRPANEAIRNGEMTEGELVLLTG